MQHRLVIPSLSGIDEAAKAFLTALGDRKLVAFHAPMGAGKTTFTAALCRVLGVPGDQVDSPTFALVNEYRTPQGEAIYHFDFYRIEDKLEALDIGLYDYLDSGSLCLMEWPEKIDDLLPYETLQVCMEVCPDDSRILSWED